MYHIYILQFSTGRDLKKIKPFLPCRGGKEWVYLLPFPPSRNPFYMIYNVIERKRVGRDCVFLGLAGLPLGIS